MSVEENRVLNKIIHFFVQKYNSPLDRIVSQYKTQFSMYFLEKIYLKEKANNYYISITNLVKKYSSPDDVIIDLGCGLGRLTFECSSLTAKKVIGIDNCASLISEAKRISKGLSSYIRPYPIKGNFEFILGDAHMLPFKSETIDLILSSNLIDRVATPKYVINEIFRVLKPGGICIHSDPFDWDEKYTQKKLWISDVVNLLPKMRYTLLHREEIEFIYPINIRRATTYMNDVCVVQKI